ncbi:MAG: hypothetical protein K1X88_22430 [Nannocystaceae bacterium]|nr:hypothetical protein [Nannocystaceae bacterium]
MLRRRRRRRWFARAGGLAAAGMLACGQAGGGSGSASSADEGTSGPGTSTSADASSGGETGVEVPAVFALVFDEDTRDTLLLRDDTVLLRLPPDAWQLGQVDAVDPDASYDPVYALPVTFASPTSVTAVEGGALTLQLGYADGTAASVRFDETARGRYSAQFLPAPGGTPTAAMRLRARCDADEGFYGMGEVFDAVEHRGRARPMQLEADLQYEGGSNEVHVPVPLAIGTRGWGLFVQDDHPGLFELATEADDLVQVTYGLGPHGDAGLRFHLFAAAHPLDVTAHLWAVTGAPALPAPWALGPWLWRNENTDAAQVLADAQTLRELDLAHSALWIDRPYATGVNTFDFEPTRFPDAQGMIDTLHDLGLRVALWHAPYVSDMDEPALRLHQEALQAGYFPPVTGLLLNKWGAAPIDFTNPDAFDWWAGLLGQYAAMGIEGYKLDYGEDVMTGVGAGRVPWAFADGSDERTMHVRFHSGYHAPYVESLPQDGGFILARAGTWGEQTQASVIWPGDLDADLSRFGDERDGSRGVGGLPSAVAAGLSLSASGFPLFASDTGGYRDGPPSIETFTRWFQHTALMPVMQIGTGSSDVAWELGDEQMLGWYREATRLHLRLFPYVWTELQALAHGGRPIVRPLGLAYPELGVHPSDVYLLGDALLVAPVIEPGATTRTLTIPPGRWVDWFDGSELDGGVAGRDVTVDAPLSKLPLWLRAGGIVPLLRPSIDSLSPTSAPELVDSFASDAGVLYARAVPEGSAARRLYDGAVLAVARESNATGVQWTSGEVFVGAAVIELLGIPAAPGSVTLDGAPLAAATDADALAAAPGWWYDAARRALWLGLPAGEHAVLASD